MKRPFANIMAGVVAISALLTSPVAAKEETKHQPPNILFILVDDLGWRDLGCYGHKIHETPHIDKLASGGMRFTNAYAACPVCGPTRASIMTGKYPSRTGFTANWLPPDNVEFFNQGMPTDRPAFMKLEETTLAEALRAGGRQTAFVGKWHLGERPYYPQHQGFDINVAGHHWGHPHKGYFSPYQMEHLKDGPKGEYLTDRLTSEAIRVMEDFSKNDRPWLMYLSYYTVHAPFHAKAEKVKKYTEKARRAKVRLNANYAAMVESLDENVGRILRWLDEKGLREDTIIVFTSDNGGFHAATDNRPLRGYKGELYEGGIRVPWIVQWPGVTKPGSVCNKPVISTDFYPTLLEVTGQALRPKQHRDGVSLVPALKGDPRFDRGPMIWHYPHHLPRHHATPGSAIRSGDWKLIYYYEDGRQELYNLKRDIGESENLVKRMPQKAAELKARLDAMLKEHGAKIPRRDPRLATQDKPHGQQVRASSRPNIVFILADDLGYGDLSCYGAKKIKTPNIDKLAKEGVLFTDAHAGASTCTPTRYGLLTGRHCFRTWLKYSALSTSAPLLIEKDRMTVALLLKSAGYSTSIVGKWHLGFGREDDFGQDREGPPNHWESRHGGPDWNGELKPGPLEVGFDTSYVIPVANSFPPYVIVENHRVEGLRKESPIGKLVSKNGGLMEGGEGARWKDEELVDKLTGKVVSQLEGFAKEKKPFFLYYAPHQPHVPHRPHPRFKGTSRFGAYGDVIQELDWSVGEILKALDRLGLSEDTLVIFSSDNGPIGGGRPRNGHWPVGRTIRGGKGDILEGGHRVPFIARWPGRIKPGTRSAETISLTDMLATFAALTGKKLPPGAGPDSYNVLPALLGEKLPDPNRPMVMLSGGMGALAIREGKWKLIDGQGACGYGHRRYKPKPGEPPMQLYNLAEDLGEANNLYTKHPKIAQRLKQTLEKTKTQGRSRSESTSTTPARGAALFTEDFNGIRDGGNGRQWQTGLPLKHSANLPGWTRTGRNSIHGVQRARGDWALQLVGSADRDNVLTLNTGFSANVKGKTYVVSFDAGPSVWAARQQATKAGHQFSIELLRADNTVLAAHNVSPGAWAGKQVFANRTFAYRGDGSGGLRFRLAPVDSKNTYFHGAIDNLQVFSSKVEAQRAVRKRVAAREERKRRQAQLLERCTPLEKDWLFQAGNNPTMKRVQQEITWARELAERLGKTSETIDLRAELKQLGELEEKLGGEPGATSAMELYFAVRRLKRAITFKNPAVDFSKVLLIDNPYPQHRHESGHRHGYRARGTGRLLVLEGLSPDSPVRSLVPKEKAGFLWRPDLSFDAEKIVFCLMPNGEKSFHLYEVNTDGTGFRQLTFGDYDDLDPIHLPNGKLMFTTTRGHTYVRCGPSHHSPVLARCDADGRSIYIVSRNNEPDFLPALLPDGRIIYTRWEYTDKEQKRVQSLWTMNPDGTGVYSFWGNQSVWPDMLVEPRPIPGSKRIMFTGVGHHRWFQGSIGIIDPARGTNYPNGLSKVTPEVAWPEVGNGPQEKAETGNYRPGRYSAYKTPYPISKEDFLVSILHPGTKKFSLYLMDFCGNRELIYTGRHNVWHAMPLKPRPRPPAIPDRIEWPEIGPNQGPLEEGVLYSANVFEGAPLLPKDKVKYLRVLQIDSKTYTPWRKTYQHSGPSISVTQADGVKRILGTTPVEADGSVCFKVPPGVSLHFQLLDKEYRCIQTMRSFTGVMPGEIRGCVGCHERRSSTPVYTTGGLAMRRGPRALTPPPWGAEVSIGYERFVQPVLDRYCGKCHQGDGKARKKLDLTLRDSSLQDPVFPSLPPQFKEPYVTLVGGGNNWYAPVDRKLISEHGLPVSIAGCLIVEGYSEKTPEALATLKPGTHMSSASLLISRAMDEKHIKAKMDPNSLRRLIGWVDANGPYLGEEEIRQMPDPVHKVEFKHPYNAAYSIPMPVVKPRLKTAPRINRFNIRQDGDSSKIYLNAKGVQTIEQYQRDPKPKSVETATRDPDLLQ